MDKIDLKNVEPVDVTDAVKPVVPMPEPVEIPEELARHGAPDGLWVYRLPNGDAYGAIGRWEPKGKRKQIRPIIWDGEKMRAVGFGENRPLYNSDLLAASPMAPVLIVEGEKTADGAQAYVPDGWIVTTWAGGSSAWQYTDWSLLDGHRCVIWPDNDKAGIGAASYIQEALAHLRVPTSIVPLGQSFPEGWDLGDPLPDGLRPASVAKVLERELNRAVIADVSASPASKKKKKGRDEGPDPDITAEMEWRPLGYDRQSYYLMPEVTLQVHEYTATGLMSERTCMEIYPSREYWAEQQGAAKRPDWVISGSDIMKKCRAAGIYDTKRLRGRGVWIDKAPDGVERTVLNTGDKLYVKRPEQTLREVSHVRIKSKWVYEARQALILDVPDYQAMATDDEGRMIREMCQLIRWGAPIYADLLSGWLATAIVCGGLPWRTHCWITGNQGSGKTQVVNRIVASVLGDLAIYPLGETTEAGIRQRLRSDALPVVFDESESGGKKGAQNSENRRQAVLGLMRQASSEGRGTIMKGSVTHTTQEFSVRSAFLLSSIGVGLKEAADLTRTAVLTVRPLDSYSLGERGKLEDNWNKMLDLQALLPLDLPQRLLARQMSNMPALRANIDVFKKAASEVLNSPRIGDQLGTLLAGSYSLYTSGVLSLDQCKKYLEARDLEEFTSVKTEREDIALLHHICGSMVRVETLKGPQERAIGELIYAVMEHPRNSDVDVSEAERLLARHGLRVCYENGRRDGMWVGQKVPALHRIMQTSDYFEGWVGVLMRHPHARRSEGSLRFGGVISRAIFIPRPEWPIHESV